jgi:hypothetical protein
MKHLHFVKGLFVLALGLSLSMTSLGQGKHVQQESGLSPQSGRSMLPMTTEQKSHMINQGNDASKAFTTLLTQDFSSTTFPPTGWTRTVVSGTMNWLRRSKVTLSYNTLNPTGTTFTNGYAMVYSDSLGSSSTAENCVLTSPTINCTGQSYVWVSFSQFFRQYGTSTGHLEVSNNGGTSWTSLYSVETGFIQNQATSNPNFADVDISSIAANQANVKIRFHWTGQYDYYWVVDDIRVYTRPQYDAALTNHVYMNPYTVVPKKQYTGTALAQGAIVKNLGGSALSNVFLTNAVINGADYSIIQTNASNIVTSLAANGTSTLTAPSYTPAIDTGFYIGINIVDATQTDGDISNDTIIEAFWVNDSMYARDDCMFTGYIDGSLGSNSGEIILGNLYTLNSPDVLTRFTTYLTGPVVGNQMQFVVYSYAAGLPTTLLGSSNVYSITTAGAQWVSLPISTGSLSLAAGTYFVGVRQVSTTTNIGIAYTNNNFTDLTSYLKIGTSAFDTLSLYGYNVTMVVRPYFVCSSYKPTITPSAAQLCTGDAFTLTSSNGSAYSWTPGGSTTNPLNITTGGTYSVQTTSTKGCVATSDPITIAEYAKPTPSITGGGTFCSNASTTLDAGSGYASYLWSPGGATSQSISVDSIALGLGITNVSCTVTSNGCSGTANTNVEFYICTGVDANGAQVNFTIQPNPSNGVINISSSDLNGSYNVIVTNNLGSVVYHKTAALANGNRLSIDLSGYNSGIYNVRIYNDQNNIVQKVVIE